MSSSDFAGRDVPLAAGSIFGLRGWKLSRSPYHKDLVLQGVRVPWNTNQLQSICPTHSNKPNPDCNCGIYSYFSIEEMPKIIEYAGSGLLSVLPSTIGTLIRIGIYGVVENTGHVVIGTKGCRAGKSRIKALTIDCTDDFGMINLDAIKSRLSARYGVEVFEDYIKMVKAHPLSEEYYNPTIDHNPHQHYTIIPGSAYSGGTVWTYLPSSSHYFQQIQYNTYDAYLSKLAYPGDYRITNDPPDEDQSA